MFIIDNMGVTDPRINLALEEYCLRHLDPLNDYLLFYINEPSVIVGKHQIPHREINCEYAWRKGLRLVRRISGGGTVYHDCGNLNFSFITGFKDQKLLYFKKLIGPIIGTLHRLGVAAEATGKNNIVVGSKKVSGTSQYTNMQRMLSHGTLLFNSDLVALNSVLASNRQMVQCRGVASAHSEVTNISDHLSRPMTIEAFRNELISGVSGSLGALKEFKLTPVCWRSVYRLAKEKYKTWEWTYGRSPAFTAAHRFKLDAADVSVHISVINGIIKNIRVAGERLDALAIPEKIPGFIGKRYDSAFNDFF